MWSVCCRSGLRASKAVECLACAADTEHSRAGPQLPRATKFGVRVTCSRYSISCKQCSSMAVLKLENVQHCPWTDVDIALNVCAVQMHAHCVRACQFTIGRCTQLAHRWCHMHSYACVQQHEHTCKCTAMIVTQMTESMQKIGRSKSKGERVHSQYNRLYWRDYQISLVDEGGQ